MGLLVDALLGLVCVVAMVTGDVYLHVPRGSNNRLNEQGQNRNNANRMFDSQNNNKGGYNVGDRTNRAANNREAQFQMTYFMSAPGATETTGNSYFPIEWTAQHGCGENTPGKPSKNNCEMVLQFMCQPDTGRRTDDATTIRDGTSTNTNNYREGGSSESQASFQSRARRAASMSRGLHEPFAWYDKCKRRRRNKGLFTADQKLKQDQATRTRQNPKGTQNGYECPEERDYYPYWHPTDWRDIAVLTEDESLCKSFYEKESFNVKPKHECRENFRNSNLQSHLSRANTETECVQRGGKWTEVHSFLEKLNLPEAQCKAAGHKWGHALYGTGQEECLVNVPPVDCQKAEYTRVNHLGNSANMKASKYMWKVPNFPSGTPQNCAFRLRYNISTDDYDPWKTDSESNGDDDVIAQDPEVNVGLPGGQKLQLALNTNQTGRTFQDRSHVFKIRQRTEAMGTKNIHMLTVRGKRGNIVQTFPAVEYDFVPNTLEIKQDDLVHFEWTGSNTHNNNNNGGDGQAGDAGEGRGGTDRNNILPMTDRANNFFMTMEDDRSMFKSMKPVWAPRGVSGLDSDDIAVRFSTSGQFRDKADLKRNVRRWQNQLNNAPASFDGMVVQFTKTGTHNYGCTRNNNFSNRSQKGTLIVK